MRKKDRKKCRALDRKYGLKIGATQLLKEELDRVERKRYTRNTEKQS